MRKIDQHCTKLEKQLLWANVMQSRKEVNLKENSLDDKNMKKQELMLLKSNTEVKLGEVGKQRAELYKETEEGSASEKQLREKEVVWVREEKQIKTKRKDLVGQSKKLVSQQKSLVGELLVLEEMRAKLSRSLSQDVLEEISLLQSGVGSLEKQLDDAQARYEQQHLDVTVKTQDLKAKETMLTCQEGLVGRLQKELINARKEKQGQVDNLACYPGARRVKQEIDKKIQVDLPLGRVPGLGRCRGRFWSFSISLMDSAVFTPLRLVFSHHLYNFVLNHILSRS